MSAYLVKPIYKNNMYAAPSFVVEVASGVKDEKNEAITIAQNISTLGRFEEWSFTVIKKLKTKQNGKNNRKSSRDSM